jgi:hypothetical protein
MSFQDLKKQSKMGSLTEKLIKQVEKLNDSGTKDDDRLWKPTMDKSGVGSAVIRFLPAPSGCEYPWVQVWSHAFKGPGGWLIDNCLTTLGSSCPICEANRELWNTGSKDNQNIVRDRKRKLSYYSNIYIVKDPGNPDNEGKVFLYKFGKKIFDKISAAMQPEFEDEQPINPFDFWKGANFKLKILKKDGYWNYDKSEFASPSVLLDDEEDLEKIYESLYDLNEFTNLNEFKSYEDLKKRLEYVLGLRGAPKSKSIDESTEDEEDDWKNNIGKEVAKEEKSYSATSSTKSSYEDDDEEEDDALSYFQKLAES